MDVLFFAQGRQAAGCDRWHLEIDRALSQKEFWTRLVEAFPGVAPLQKSARLARRECYLAEADLLGPDDEIAVLPPVSGG
jgi:molybdopterin converting factor small subunit